LGLTMSLAGCGGASTPDLSGGTVITPTPTPTPAPSASPSPEPEISLGVQATPVATINAPWSLTFLPSGDALVGQRIYGGGAISLVTQTGEVSKLQADIPAPNNGVLDVALDPDYAANHRIFFTFIEVDPAAPRIGRPQDAPNENPEGTAVASATLALDGRGGGRLSDIQVIWRQLPKITTPEISGNFGAKLAFSPDGQYLFVSNGDRQELVSGLIVSMATTIGKVVRIRPDGTIPSDNPFYGQPGVAPEIWTMGHRNPYGLAFDLLGNLWENENGPMGGDELNLLLPSSNYGWPLVSNGDDYDGRVIPDHSTGDGFEAPRVSWTPVIAPSDMLFYHGTSFRSWQGDALLTGLKAEAIVRVRITGGSAREVQRIAMGARIRSIAEAPDGALWVLEDAPSARLLRLTPVKL